ncbi:SGNH/GDSL hydrolase family protein [Pelagibius sp. Alg239-R121]|uniref:SGNH/GDSL hydrolase family protein n=1 Tax=Pelagibius sp. Alg239-R121 TaxID=2993448 RepID=UPI0024A6F142|nr:SGNH/GDSL hydrolase family protein [Pelagibius sp. Alg239-R121]
MVTIPDEYMRPEMMAIGDSLYQGVRSLTMKSGMMQLSAPALAAEGLGIRHRFSCPDPQRPIIVDMEKWLRMLPDIGRIKEDMAKNIDYWFKTKPPSSPSGRLLFENISIASATIADLYTQTWQSSDDFLKTLPPGAKTRIKKLNLAEIKLSPTIQALNARFTLNPSGQAEYRNLSQVGMVAARKPKRLLVNIGSNNGLWEIAFECNPNARMKFKTELKKLAQALNALPPEVEHIYFNNLGLPSTVPNLMPVPEQVEWDETNKPGKGKYYDTYENRFGFGYGCMTGKQLKKLDEHIAEVNKEAAQILKSAFDKPSRLHFVDIAKLLLSYDSKHQKRTDKNVVNLANGKTITNVMVNASPFGNFRRGGTQGLDGMHASVVGYGLMAQQVLDCIEKAEPGLKPSKIDLNAAFDRDKLLNDLPPVWNAGLWLWRDIRRAQAEKKPEPVEISDDETMRDVMRFSSQAVGRP